MPEVAYRFVPCAEDGHPSENSQYTWIRDATETIEVGSSLDTERPLLGHCRWEVVEIRKDAAGLLSVSDKDGTPIPLGGTLVCRGIA